MKRPTPIALEKGFKLRVVRGPKEKKWYWRLVRREEGKDCTYSSFWASQADAILKASELVSTGSIENKKSDFNLLIEQWHYSDHFSSLSELTQRQYRSNSRHLINQFENYPSRADVSKAVYRMLNDGLSYRTVKGILTAGGSFHQWASSNTDIKGSSPFAGHNLPDKGMKPKYTPSKAEVQKLTEALTGWQKFAVQWLQYTGLRIGEVESLTWEHVNLDRNEITIHGKGSRYRVIRLPQQLKDILLDQDPEEELFPVKNLKCPEFYNTLRNTCDELNLPRFTPHSFRRYLINIFRSKGVPVQVAAKHFGHSPVVMMKHYEEISQAEINAAADSVFDDL